MNIQVALRKEMKIEIVEVAQVHDNFLLLGRGNEGTVVGYHDELARLIDRVNEHLQERMGSGSPASQELEEELNEDDSGEL